MIITQIMFLKHSQQPACHQQPCQSQRIQLYSPFQRLDVYHMNPVYYKQDLGLSDFTLVLHYWITSP